MLTKLILYPPAMLIAVVAYLMLLLIMNAVVITYFLMSPVNVWQRLSEFVDTWRKK